MPFCADRCCGSRSMSRGHAATRPAASRATQRLSVASRPNAYVIVIVTALHRSESVSPTPNAMSGSSGKPTARYGSNGRLQTSDQPICGVAVNRTRSTSSGCDQPDRPYGRERSLDRAPDAHPHHDERRARQERQRQDEPAVALPRVEQLADGRVVAVSVSRQRVVAISRQPGKRPMRRPDEDEERQQDLEEDEACDDCRVSVPPQHATLHRGRR